MRRATLALAAGFTFGAAMFAATGPAAADDVPYTDPSQVGYIGFCDAHNHPITGGSLDAIPFAAKAVSSAPAEAPYDGNGRVAFVNAYQPRSGIPPAEWSGEALISASFYSSPAHPTVVGTKGDVSMLQIVQDLPPQWDDLVQLRMYLKVPDLPYDALHYVATDIRIDGDTWHVARGGTVPCDSGKATSIASILVPSAAAGAYNTTSATSATPGGTGSAGSDGTSSTTPTSTPAQDSGSLRSAAPAAETGSAASSNDSFPVGYVALGGLAAVIAAVLIFTQRRRFRSLARRQGGRG